MGDRRTDRPTNQPTEQPTVYKVTLPKSKKKQIANAQRNKQAIEGIVAKQI